MSDETALAQRGNGALEQCADDTASTKIAFDNAFDVGNMLENAGNVKLTKAEIRDLFAPVDEADVEIRPDGIVYLPWMEYASRLTKTFPMQWAMIPQGMPKLSQRDDGQVRILWGFWLIIKGSMCGYAIGEHTYYAKSKSGKEFMGYSDACEAAKSNALMRLCKGIGISLELWKPSFIREWKEKYAIQTQHGWKRRDTPDMSALVDACKKELAKWQRFPGCDNKTIGNMIDTLADPTITAEGLNNMLKEIRKQIAICQESAIADDASTHPETDGLPGPDADVQPEIF